MSARGLLAVALDLGSTRLKAAGLRADGTLGEVRSVPAPIPAARADPWRCEFDAAELLARARGLLHSFPLAGAPLAIASQRSTFLLWDRASGAPATPAISWRDRSAADFCERHRRAEGDVRRATGLPLSPHYAGPKLAALLERDRGLAARARAGELLFGTLETWLVWNESGRRAHETDLTMAARTLLADPARGDWDQDLLDLFAVPRSLLPALVDSAGRRTACADGSYVAASLADQAAGALAALGGRRDRALANLGTGGFVLRATGARRFDLPGYLSGPIFSRAQERSFALEGTINGGAATLERLSPLPAGGSAAVPAADPAPEAFCIPDEDGVGAPHWKPRPGPTWSQAAAALDGASRRRVLLEGLVFRVAEIVADLRAAGPLRAVVLAGGLSREPLLRAGLAACLDEPLEVLGEAEGTLLGAARLAADLDCGGEAAPGGPPLLEEGAGWMREKRARWTDWLADVLAT